MKIKFAITLCVAIIVLSGCVKEDKNEVKDLIESQTDEALINEIQIEEDQTEEIQDIELNILDESEYIGEYLDYDCNEPNLEIAKGNDGKYIVQIGIFRLLWYNIVVTARPNKI